MSENCQIPLNPTIPEHNHDIYRWYVTQFQDCTKLLSKYETKPKSITSTIRILMRKISTRIPNKHADTHIDVQKTVFKIARSITRPYITLTKFLRESQLPYKLSGIFLNITSSHNTLCALPRHLVHVYLNSLIHHHL